MSDDNREMDTHEASSAEEKPAETAENTQSVTEESHPQSKSETAAEEVEFNSLSGSAQDRIRTIIQERNQLKEQLTRQAQDDNNAVGYSSANSYQPSQSTSNDAEVQKAAQLLKEKAGMVTREELDRVLARIETDKIHSTLEKEFDGSNDTPRYDRVEVEDYARRHNIWDLRAAYRDMYFDELVDSQKSKQRRSYSPTEKPRASTPQEPVTISSIREKLRGPEGRAYYEKLASDPRKFDELLQELAQEE